MTNKKDLECGEPELDSACRRVMELPSLPKSLSFEEKKYLLAVERGDMANVRRILQKAHRLKHIDCDCVDSLGRGALTLAIEGENMEMVELLVVMGVQTKDALLQAINSEFVEAVELLLEHEELIHKDGEPYSWQKIEANTAMFHADITPLMLAAHKNNYEIIKILLDRGATLPNPHDVRCGCDDCIRESSEDSLRHSLGRLNEYRALASPSLIALSSFDPILTAFQLSWELRNLAFAEQESKAEYLELRRQTQQFAVDLLDQSRSSQELAIILNHDPEEPPFEEGEHMKLARLELAITYKQKKFVAHANIQQLLASIWYEGVPGFRRKSAIEKVMIILRVALLFPFYCSLYMVAPNCSTGKLMRKPFMKFLIHASSYLFFLLILILVSLRADVQVIYLFGPDWMVKNLEQELLKQRGNGPTFLEIIVIVYVLGFIWEETQEIYIEGMRSYLRNLWNFIDFTRNSLYFAVALLRIAAYLQQASEISRDPQTRFIPREHWDDFDPQLIAEGLFAAANIFSALKLVHLFSINPHLGPLQISLGRMVIDIIKFFFIYSLVLFAFACGLNQLLWYFADLEKKKCYVLPGGLPDWDNAGDSCMKWRSFGNVFESSQSLFWASFGMVGLENFELAGIKSYTRFWGLLMFGSYSVINVIVLLNLLIAMMSNSYAMIVEHADTEWKFARTGLWMSYFDENATLPPPFNIFPTPKLLFKLLGIREKDKLRKTKAKKNIEKEEENRYNAVTRALVWRYVSTMHRRMDDEPVTEDDVNELKGDISALRYELLEVFDKNGYDVSFTDRKEKAVLGKRMKMWERRLMKDFQVAPVAGAGDDQPSDENGLARFRRIAKMAIANSTGSKWDATLAAVGVPTQIGKCKNRASFKSQQNLKRAMAEAQKLVLRTPIAGDNIATISGGLLSAAAAPRSTSTTSASSSPGSPNPSNVKMPSKGPTLSTSPTPLPRPSTPVFGEIASPGRDQIPRLSKSKPSTTGSDERYETKEDVTLETSNDDIAVARPVAPGIKPAEGSLLPPPPSTTKSKAPGAPTMEITPCSPNHCSGPPSPTKRPISPKTPISPLPLSPKSPAKPISPLKSPARPTSPLKSPAKPTSPLKSPTKLTSLPKAQAPLRPSTPPKTPSRCSTPKAAPARPTSTSLSSRSVAPVSRGGGLMSTSSTEQLIPPSSPKPLKPGQKIDEVKTIKRQPKTGWL